LAAWWAATSARVPVGSGRPFLWATIAYAAGRLLVDAYRENAALMAGGLHVTQVGALAVLLTAIALLAWPAGRREGQTAE